MTRRIHWTPLWVAMAGCAWCADALATNGYFAHGYSVSQKAMGGAGTAMTEDAFIGVINPAGTYWVGDRMDASLSLFAPVRNYRAGERGPDASNGVFTVEPGRSDSDNELFYIPGFAYARRIDDASSWGVAVVGNGGMNTEYHGANAEFATGLIGLTAQCHGAFGGGQPIGSDLFGFCGKDDPTASVDLIQLFVMPNYSLRIAERISIGIAPIIAGQRFRADGLRAFATFSNQPDRVSDNGYDLSYGYGGRVGIVAGVLPGVGIGASYQSRIRMTPFDKYAGLFADQGDFDIPSNWNVGLAVKLTDDQRFAFDYQKIHFGEIRSVGNPLDPNRFVNDCAIPRLLGDSSNSTACLGAKTGPGFGWEGIEVYKFGYQIQFGAFKWRAGYSRTHQPIPRSEVLFNILAPGVPDEHFTGGFSYELSESLSIDVAIMYAKSNPVVGKNPLSNSGANLATILLTGVGVDATSNAFGEDPDDQDIRLDMHQFEASFGIGYRF